MERPLETTQYSASAITLEGSYMDWSAILGGTVVAIAVGSIFTAFGAALGLSVISAEPNEGSFNAILIISAIWIALSMVASYMTGGYIAGRMRRRLERASSDEVTARDGLNGLVVWGLGTIVSALILHSLAAATLSTAGSVAAATGSAAGSVAETAAQVAGNVAGGAAQGAMAAADASTVNPLDFIKSTLLRPTLAAPAPATGEAPATVDYSADVGSILTNVATTGEISDAESDYLVSAVAAQAGVTPAEAASRVEAGIAKVQDVRAKAEAAMAEAEATAIKAAEIARISAILAAFFTAATALISAVAAHAGAVKGGIHRDEGRIFGGFAHHRRA